MNVAVDTRMLHQGLGESLRSSEIAGILSYINISAHMTRKSILMITLFSADWISQKSGAVAERTAMMMHVET